MQFHSIIEDSLVIRFFSVTSTAQVLAAVFFYAKRKAAISSCAIQIAQSVSSFLVIFLSLSLLLLFMLILVSVVMLVDVFTLSWLIALSPEL